MANSEQDLASPSLISRIEQLEERQNIVSKYMVGLKRQFDGLTHELQQIESLKEQIKELQQRFNQLPTLSKILNNAETLNGASESANFDESETVKQWLERVEQQQCQKVIAPTLIEQSSESVGGRAEIGVNANTTETDPDEETDAAAQQEEYTTAFNDEEFKTERMMWLLNRIYTAEQ